MSRLLTEITGVVYAATALPTGSGYARLDEAVATLLEGIDVTPPAEVLWKMQYQQRSPTPHTPVDVRRGLIALPSLPTDLVLDDSVLDEVKKAWRSITGELDDAFMHFEERNGFGEDD